MLEHTARRQFGTLLPCFAHDRCITASGSGTKFWWYAELAPEGHDLTTEFFWLPAKPGFLLVAALYFECRCNHEKSGSSTVESTLVLTYGLGYLGWDMEASWYLSAVEALSITSRCWSVLPRLDIQAGPGKDIPGLFHLVVGAAIICTYTHHGSMCSHWLKWQAQDRILGENPRAVSMPFQTTCHRFG